MGIQRKIILLVAVSTVAFLGIAVPAAPVLKNSFCLDCHDDKTLSKTNAAGQQISLFVDKAQLAASAHQTNSCVSCHIDATAKHPDDHKVLQPVDCAACHDKPVKREGVNAHTVKKSDK
jgi:hypothetical protein